MGSALFSGEVLRPAQFCAAQIGLANLALLLAGTRVLRPFSESLLGAWGKVPGHGDPPNLDVTAPVTSLEAPERVG